MIPRNLKYQNKKDSAYARNYTSNIAPQNGTNGYTGGTTIIINIPTAQNIVLAGSESTLKFNLNVTNGGASNAYVRLDKAGAHGVIQRLRLYHGSTLLEDFDTYGNMVSGAMALQQSGDATRGKMNIMAGLTNESFCGVTNATVTDAASMLTFNLAANNQVSTLNSGERLPALATPTNPFAALGAGNKTITRTYSITLMSLLGSLSDKYIPLFAMTSAPLRLELQLVNTPSQFICSSAALASYAIDNVEYIGQFMELGGEAMNIINNSLPNGRLEWVVPSYSNFVHNAVLGTAVTQVSIPIAAKYSSLKSLFITPRLYASGAPTFFPFGSCHFNLAQYNLRLGSKVVPSKAPETIPEFFVECVKAIGSVADINHEPNINMRDYDAVVPVANAETAKIIAASSSSPSFMIGIDLETYSNADKDSIYSGYNTSTDDVFLNATFNANAGALSVRFDTYALYDSVITCENGATQRAF